MRKLVSILLTLALVVSFVMAAPVGAQDDVVFSNYDKASGDYDAWNNTSYPPPLPIAIEAFTTKDTPGQWDIAGIKLNAYGGGILGGGISPASVRIYTDATGTSIVSGAEWDINIDTGMGEDFSFAVSGVTLDANTTYWFGLEITSNTAGGWQQTTDGSHVFELTGTLTEANTIVGLTVETSEITAISVTPTDINFGTVGPGESVSGDAITVTNLGMGNIDVDADLELLTGTVFKYLQLNGSYSSGYEGHWVGIIKNLLPKGSEELSTGLVIPSSYSAQGSETATLVFTAVAG